MSETHTAHTEDIFHTQLHLFISKLLLYMCNKQLHNSLMIQVILSVLSSEHLTGLMATPLVAHISHLLEIGTFHWKKNVLDGFWGILWIKLVIKIR